LETKEWDPIDSDPTTPPAERSLESCSSRRYRQRRRAAPLALCSTSGEYTFPRNF